MFELVTNRDAIAFFLLRVAQLWLLYLILRTVARLYIGKPRPVLKGWGATRRVLGMFVAIYVPLTAWACSSAMTNGWDAGTLVGILVLLLLCCLIGILVVFRVQQRLARRSRADVQVTSPKAPVNVVGLVFTSLLVLLLILLFPLLFLPVFFLWWPFHARASRWACRRGLPWLPKPKPFNLRTRGVTLIEVLIIIALVAILAIPISRLFSTIAKTDFNQRQQVDAVSAAQDQFALWRAHGGAPEIGEYPLDEKVVEAFPQFGEARIEVSTSDIPGMRQVTVRVPLRRDGVDLPPVRLTMLLPHGGEARP